MRKLRRDLDPSCNVTVKFFKLTGRYPKLLMVILADSMYFKLADILIVYLKPRYISLVVIVEFYIPLRRNFSGVSLV